MEILIIVKKEPFRENKLKFLLPGIVVSFEGKQFLFSVCLWKLVID